LYDGQRVKRAAEKEECNQRKMARGRQRSMQNFELEGGCERERVVEYGRGWKGVARAGNL
jgi:hypothetical protein